MSVIQILKAEKLFIEIHCTRYTQWTFEVNSIFRPNSRHGNMTD